MDDPIKTSVFLFFALHVAFLSTIISCLLYTSDLGINISLLYRWRKKYTPEGEKTQFATLEEENRALKLENAELKIERDMLKKAAAYFAKNQK